MSQHLLDKGTGPGGVGQTNGRSSLVLWLKADADVTTKGRNVSHWLDQSGYGHHALQSTATAQPLLVERSPHFNHRSAIYFDGQNDYLRVNHTNHLDMRTGLTVFAVIHAEDLQHSNGIVSKSESCGQGANFAVVIKANQRQLWFEHFDDQWRRYPSMGTVGKLPVIISLVYDARAVGDAFHLNGRTMGRFDSRRTLVPNTQPLEIGTHNRCALEGDWFSGELAELIIYNEPLLMPQRILVENYLGARYGITLPPTEQGKDVYRGDTAAHGHFDRDVVGLGRAGGHHHSEAHSAGLSVIDRTFLQQDDTFLMFGHKSLTNDLLTSELPDDLNQRWERVWFFDLTRPPNSDGKVTLLFDLKAAEGTEAATMAGSYSLLERADEASPFRVIATAESSLEGTVSFSLSASQLTSGRQYTLGRTLPVSLLDLFVNRVRDWLQPKSSPPLADAPAALPAASTVQGHQQFNLVAPCRVLLDKGNDLTADDVRQALDHLTETIQPHLPGDIMSKVTHIHQAVVDTLPYIADVNSSDQTVYVVRQVALEYLPETLENYLNLPPSFANQTPVKDDKTARQLLLEQLDLLAHEMRDIATDFHRRDAQRLVAHGRFLQEKFTRGDSLLD